MLKNFNKTADLKLSPKSEKLKTSKLNSGSYCLAGDIRRYFSYLESGKTSMHVCLINTRTPNSAYLATSIPQPFDQIWLITSNALMRNDRPSQLPYPFWFAYTFREQACTPKESMCSRWTNRRNAARRYLTNSKQVQNKLKCRSRKILNSFVFCARPAHYTRQNKLWNCSQPIFAYTQANTHSLCAPTSRFLGRFWRKSCSKHLPIWTMKTHRLNRT